jgi:hypothetical protein
MRVLVDGDLAYVTTESTVAVVLAMVCLSICKWSEEDFYPIAGV